MVRNASGDLDITNNIVEPTIGCGIPTKRKVSWLGNSDITINQASVRVSSTIYFSPTAGATDNIICSSLYTAAGTIAYGSRVSSYHNILAPATAGQALLSNRPAIAWSALPTSFVWTSMSTPLIGVVGTG